MIPETVFGLPAHPLIVHAAVVFIPLAAVGVLAIVLVPRWRLTYGWLVVGVSVVALASSFVAKLSGEAFKDRLVASGAAGGPVAERLAEHQRLGETLPWFVLALAVLAFALVVLTRGHAAAGLVLAVAVLAVVAAGGATVQVVRTGDAGASAVWNPTR